MITYLALKEAHHKTTLDRQYAESVFESYSIKAQTSELSVDDKDATTPKSAEDRIVTKGNAILASDEIFKMWKVDLNADQQKKLKEVYF
mgnify:CR=1 FL=1